MNAELKWKYSLYQQDLCQQTKRSCCHFKGAGRRRVGEGGHHAVNDVGHQTQHNKCSDQHEPRPPLEDHRPPWRTPLELVLDKRERKERLMTSPDHCTVVFPHWRIYGWSNGSSFRCIENYKRAKATVNGWHCWRVSPALWSRLKHLNDYWMDCHEILHKHFCPFESY